MGIEQTKKTNEMTAEQGKAVLAAFREETKHPMEAANALLMRLLEDNKDTEYGKKYGFADIHSIEDYQKKVPVATYDTFAPYLERMMAGEKDILTAYSFNHFNETSGTVGNPKVVPMTDRQSDVFAKYTCICTACWVRTWTPTGWTAAPSAPPAVTAAPCPAA